MAAAHLHISNCEHNCFELALKFFANENILINT